MQSAGKWQGPADEIATWGTQGVEVIKEQGGQKRKGKK